MILTPISQSLQGSFTALQEDGSELPEGIIVKRISVALLALALAAAACGGTEASTGVASLDEAATTTTAGAGDATVDTEEAVLAFAECLRAEGLDVPDPEFDGEGGFTFGFREAFRVEGGGPDEEFQGAFEACGELLEGVAQQFERPDLSEIQDDLLAFAECMRDNGIEVADPDLSELGQGPGRGRIFDLDINDPLVQAAGEICQSELAFARPGGGPGGGRAGGSGS